MKLANIFDNKVAIVTGGGMGIGEALSNELAALNATVVVADIDLKAATKVSEQIQKRGGHAVAAQLDVSKEEEVRGLVEKAFSDFGHLDYTFNNAGIAIGGDARDLTLAQWRLMLDVDLYGVIYGTLAAYDIMVKQGSGHIVNTSSATGLVPQPGNAPYCTSKHGVVGLSLSLRFEGADLGVKVSVVSPGNVHSNMYQNMVVAHVNRDQFVAKVSQRKQVETSKAARIILKEVAHNRSIIIFPASVKLAWRIYRLFPDLLDRAWLGHIRDFRKDRETASFRPPNVNGEVR